VIFPRVPNGQRATAPGGPLGATGIYGAGGPFGATRVYL
jgi:hypothetical protein